MIQFGSTLFMVRWGRASLMIQKDPVTQTRLKLVQVSHDKFPFIEFWQGFVMA